MLAMAGTSGTSKGGNFENNSPLREGAPIGFKNPAQTCWLNSVLTMLFGGQSPLAKALLSLNPTKIDDLFTKALYYMVKDMHNKDKTWLTYKNDQNIPGPFWQELKTKMKNIDFNRTEEDIDAFTTLLDSTKKVLPDFDTTFGAEALGKRIGEKIDGYIFQPLFEAENNDSIDNDTLPSIFESAAQGKIAIQKTAPDLFWIRPFVAQKTPIPFALGLDLTKQFKATGQVLYLISSMTIYKIYRSVLEGGNLSEEKIHYASLIADKTRKEWYLVDDSVVKTISAEEFAKFSDAGVLVTEHQGVDQVYKTVWYPSILQYALRKQPQEDKKKSLKKEKFSLEKEEEMAAELKKKQEEEDYLFAKQLQKEEEEE